MPKNENKTKKQQQKTKKSRDKLDLTADTYIEKH